MADVIELDSCPRCGEDLSGGHMTGASYGIRWCYLCAFDIVDDSPSDRAEYIARAKAMVRNQKERK